MKFDPTKPFGTVYGACKEYPGAKFEQFGFIYDAHHRCINPKAKVIHHTSADLAVRERLNAKTAQLDKLTKDIAAAQVRVEAEDTAASKGALTKLKKKYDGLHKEIDLMRG